MISLEEVRAMVEEKDHTKRGNQLL